MNGDDNKIDNFVQHLANEFVVRLKIWKIIYQRVRSFLLAFGTISKINLNNGKITYFIE